MAHLRVRTLVVAAALTLVPIAASAHAILVESSPATNGTVPQGRVDIRLRYNSRIDHSRSRLTLTPRDGAPAVLAIALGAAEDILTSSAELSPGVYRLGWQVLAVDGHITRGDVPFTVTAPGSESPKTSGR
jgi:methionine-rich copper-binding protein CopC